MGMGRNEKSRHEHKAAAALLRGNAAYWAASLLGSFSLIRADLPLRSRR